MESRKSLPLLVMLLSVLLTACATGTAGRPPTSCPPAALAAAAAPAAPVLQDESLLKYIPESAVAAVLVRRSAFSLIDDLLGKDTPARQEGRRHLERTLGLDVTSLEGVAGFAIGASTNPPAAVFLRINAPGTLKLKSVPQIYRGVSLYPLEERLFVARLPAGLVVGIKQGIELAIDLAAGRARSLADSRSSSAPLAQLRDHDRPGFPCVVAVHVPSIPGLPPQVTQLGLGTGLLHYNRETAVLAASMQVAPAQREAVRGLIMSALGVAGTSALIKLDKERQSDDPWVGLGAIYGYHRLKQLLEEVQPRVVEGRLVSQCNLGQLWGAAGALSGQTAMLGILAAVAVPAFIKYIRKSKTVEATEGLDKIKVGVTAYYQAQRKKGRAFAFPASTEWTPATTCCEDAASKPRCSASPATFANPTWKLLHFSLSEPHYYQYRFTSQGKGKKATFTAEARGDLDCDKTFSSYRLEGSIDKKGELQLRGPIIENEIE